MKFWSNPTTVEYSPVVTSFLIEGSTFLHIRRMWTEHSAVGQSLISWVFVIIAMFLWLNWYRVLTPEKKIAIYTVSFSVLVNIAALLSVIYWRYHGS